MSSNRRQSSGRIDVGGLLPTQPEESAVSAKSHSTVVAELRPALSNGGLDLTALTSSRRKSRGAIFVDLNQLDMSGGSSSGSSGGPHQPLTVLSRQNSTGSERDRGEKRTTPRSGRRVSRTGSISGLTAEQALTLSAQYGAEASAANAADTASVGTKAAATGDAAGLKSISSTGSRARRGSFSNSGSFRFGAGHTAGSPSDSNPAMQALKRRSSFSGVSSSSLHRRGSFGNVNSSGVNSSTGSRRGSNDNDNDNSASENISSSRYDAAFESKLIAEAQRAMEKHKGRSISSIKKSPKYGIRNASSERGVTVITKNICLGGRDDASDLATLRKLGITHVLNVAAQLPNFQEEDLVCLKIPLHDSEDTDITKVVPLASSFISRAEDSGGRVLVHCISGVSRSTTLVLMHLMQKHRIILKNAYAYVHSCRPWVSPNEGFRLQLARMEIMMWGSSSVAAPGSGAAWNFYNWNNEKTSATIMKASERDKAAEKEGDCIDSIFRFIFGM